MRPGPSQPGQRRNVLSGMSPLVEPGLTNVVPTVSCGAMLTNGHLEGAIGATSIACLPRRWVANQVLRRTPSPWHSAGLPRRLGCQPACHQTGIAELGRWATKIMRSLLVFLAVMFVGALSVRANETDNRHPKPVTVIPFALRDEVELLRAVAASGHKDLLTALDAAFGKWPSMRLKWNQRISLKDADYVLCLFDSEGHAFPGDNPRVLILFTLRYEVAAWGAFTCEPFFGFGSILSPLEQPNTYFITVNPSGRFGGALWFEEYLISPLKIEKVGEGPSYPISPKQQPATK
jgi:hypothetical protein